MEQTMRRSSLKSRITRITRLGWLRRNLSTMDGKTSSNQFLIIKIEFHIIPPFLLDFPMNSYMDDIFFSSAIFDLAEPPFFRSDAVGSEGPRAQQHPHHAEAAQEAGVGQAFG